MLKKPLKANDCRHSHTKVYIGGHRFSRFSLSVSILHTHTFTLAVAGNERTAALPGHPPFLSDFLTSRRCGMNDTCTHTSISFVCFVAMKQPSGRNGEGGESARQREKEEKVRITRNVMIASRSKTIFMTTSRETESKECLFFVLLCLFLLFSWPLQFSMHSYSGKKFETNSSTVRQRGRKRLLIRCLRLQHSY